MSALGPHTLPDGRIARVVEIAAGGAAGIRARVSSLGAALLALHAPDAAGRVANVVLGHESLADYADDPAYLGAAVGRTAGRVRAARVEIDGQAHALDANDGENTLHGGPAGLNTLVWTVDHEAPERVVLAVASPDGAGGFPGTLTVRLALSVAPRADGPGGTLALDWHAEATAPTPAALTLHLYLNLDGEGTVLDQTLEVPAEQRLELAPDLTATGRLVPVAGTPFDLRAPVRLGDVLASDAPSLAGGLDHDWLVGPPDVREAPLRHALTVRGRTRRLDVWTTEPCVHLYDGAFLRADRDGHGPHAGLAVETQPPPDAVRLAHRPGFPDIVLRPGGALRSRTEYRFRPI